MDVTLGEAIKVLRQRKGLSQSQLAKLAGVSRNALASLEHDKSNYTLRVLRSVADALGFTAEIRMCRPNHGAQPTAELAGSEPIAAESETERQPGGG